MIRISLFTTLTWRNKQGNNEFNGFRTKSYEFHLKENQTVLSSGNNGIHNNFTYHIPYKHFWNLTLTLTFNLKEDQTVFSSENNSIHNNFSRIPYESHFKHCWNPQEGQTVVRSANSCIHSSYSRKMNINLFKGERRDSARVSLEQRYR